MADRDEVTIESLQGGDFSIIVDRATSYEITTDLAAPGEARFELGDNESWSALRGALATGTRFLVRVGGRPRLAGRLLAKRAPATAAQGATIQATIRTVLADAQYASAPPTISVKNATLRDVILAAYKPLGIDESKLVTQSDLARKIATGKGGKSKPPADLAKLTEEDAKVHPPETVFAFVERHLNRFHLTHWDGPDGTLVVGAPDDSQIPHYTFRCFQNELGSANNCEIDRTEDYEQVPSRLDVFGVGGGKLYSRAKVRSIVEDPVLAAVTPPIYRSVLVVDEGVKLQAAADARAARELSARSLQKDAFRVTRDGYATDGVPHAIDTVADILTDIDHGAAGSYLVHRVTLTGDASAGHTSVLECVAQGVWRI